MMAKRLIAVLGLAVLVLILASASIVKAGSTGYEPILPNAPRVDVLKGDTGTIGLIISGENISGYGVGVSCDPLVVGLGSTYEAVTIPGFTVFAGPTGVSGYTVGQPFSGTATVGTISFTAVGEPGSSTDIGATGGCYDFDGGSAGTVSCSPTSITIVAPPSPTPEPSPSLTISVSPAGSGTTDPPAGTHTYDAGAIVNLTATPTAGWEFVNWTGEVDNPNAATTRISMAGNRAITANFIQTEAGDTTPPVCTSIAAASVTQTAAEIRWTTNEPADSQVEYWASPGQFTPLDANMVTQHIVHLTGLNPATTYHYKVMSRDAVGNLTVSTEATFVTAGAATGMTSFITGQWDIQVKDAGTGKAVTISHVVTNTGDQPGAYRATLSINGAERETKEVNLNPGESQDVSFTVSIEEAGDYTATIGDTTLLFSVGQVAASGNGLQTWLLIGLWVIVMPAAVLTTMAVSRRRQRLAPAQVNSPVPVAPAPEPAQAEVYRTEYRVGDGILTVTGQAAEKLRATLRSKSAEPGTALRITRSAAVPTQLKMFLDTQKPDDIVVSSLGVKMLYLSPDVTKMLEGVIIDYQVSERGGTFTLSRPNLTPE